MMPHERRVNIRRAPEHLAYLSLPLDNGGIVLDVSEGGLRFHTIARVEADGPIHFRFAIDSAARTKAVGELTWIDETGKTGGLRFTELPDEVREQIRDWVRLSKTSAKASVLDIPVARPALEADVALGGKSDLAAVVDNPAAEPAAGAGGTPSSKVDLAPAAATGYPLLLYHSNPPIYSAPSNKLSMFPLELNSETVATADSVRQSLIMRNPIAAVGLTIALAFLVSIGIFAYVSTSRAGELLLDWGEKLLGGYYLQPIPRDPPPPASFEPVPTNIPQK
jgi:hypothetical protein